MNRNGDYLLSRCGWLVQVSRGFDENEASRGLVIDKLNRINNVERIEGVVTTGYPVFFKVRYNEEIGEGEVEAWVKETRIARETEIPVSIINENKILRTVIRDMFYLGRSPHFVFPVIQILTNDFYEEEHFVVYSITEYLPEESYTSLRDFLKNMDLEEASSRLALVAIVFQVLFNLSVMERLRFHHGNLDMNNILVNPREPFHSVYVIDETTAYEVPSPAFAVFTNFEYSSIKTKEYSSITDPREEWNPHADLIKFLTPLFASEGVLSILFPKDTNLQTELGSLISTRGGGEESCLPSSVVRRYSEQFFTRRDPKTIDGNKTQVYGAF